MLAYGSAAARFARRFEWSEGSGNAPIRSVSVPRSIMAINHALLQSLVARTKSKQRHRRLPAREGSPTGMRGPGVALLEHSSSSLALRPRSVAGNLRQRCLDRVEDQINSLRSAAKRHPSNRDARA